MAENILTVENLNIAYQGVPAVMDVNFTLERGKVLTIVGESGSGKTTVIRALMGLLPVGGEVTEGFHDFLMVMTFATCLNLNGDLCAAKIWP